MIPRLGKIKAHHFAHKVANSACSCETYLHRLAKRTIKNKFDSSNEFLITYYQKVKCDKSGRCYLKEECENDILVTFDLKKYYDQCLVESPIQGFIADVLFFNSTKKYDPVLIEIQVSHKCTVAKTQSGLKIIEIEVNDEADITMLAKSSIVESSNSGSGPVTSFYGFVKDSKETKQMENRLVKRFYLFENYSVYVDSVSCRYAENKSDKRTLLELNIIDDIMSSSFTPYYSPFGISPYYYGLAKAIDLGFKVKSCSICKYVVYDDLSGEFICKLYKKLATPRCPEPKFALGCTYYRIDAKLIKDVREAMSDVSITKVERILPNEYDI